nr:immunoglobulin light chain junction region [Macaca mulatta]MOV92224.1 immunoglobulin light chain junction region [Macaca mulatta]MOV92244.1 immunoglobulin light chain junction region [Macaca mulatta]MOV92351.1 immunoglobulin light chain junction region [Macaca mulatta]MOV92371.1 immunoglobulin light chain junction region [Macaca mulatta]
CQKYSYSPWTF